MSIFALHKRVWFKAMATAVVCLFLVNNVSWASGGNIKESFHTLQVQLMYAPITDVIGRTFEKQIKTETSIILSSVLRNPSTPFQDINASIDEWYGILAREENPRLLNVVENPQVDEGEVQVLVELFSPEEHGKTFRLTSSARSLSEINDPFAEIIIEEIDRDNNVVRSSRAMGNISDSEDVPDDEPGREEDENEGKPLDRGQSGKLFSVVTVPLIGDLDKTDAILSSAAAIGIVLLSILGFVFYKVGGFSWLKDNLRRGLAKVKDWFIGMPAIRNALRNARKRSLDRRTKKRSQEENEPGRGLDDAWMEKDLMFCAPLYGVERRVVAVGDIHGALGGFRDILEGVGLIEKGQDPNGLEDVWTGGNAIFIQGGDVIDRGEKSIESIKYLRYLRLKADEAHGEVVRLLGNHELNYLLKNAEGSWKGQIERFKNMPRDDNRPDGDKVIQGFDENLWQNSDELVAMLKEDVLNGSLVASYDAGGKLFTHGIVTRGLVDAMQRHTWKDVSVVEEFVQAANNALVRAVKKNRFEHEIFSMGYGVVPTEAQGLTSLYISDLFKKHIKERYSNFPFDSVVFHDPTIFSLTEYIPAKKMPNGKTVACADVGMTDYYGGGRAALVFEGGKSKAAYPKWGRKVYDSYVDHTRDKAPQEPYTGPDRALIVAGPSGAGKSTFLKFIKEVQQGRFESPPVFTTRNQRFEEEYDGSKIFVGKKTFMNLKDDGKLSMVRYRHGHWYGVFNPDLEDIKRQGKIIQFDTSSLDSLNLIRRRIPSGYVAFVSPLSAEELGIDPDEGAEVAAKAIERFALKHPEMLKLRLRERMEKRGGMPEKEMEIRLDEAVELCLEAPNVDPDLVIFNEDLKDLDDNLRLFGASVDEFFKVFEGLVTKGSGENGHKKIGKQIEVSSIYEDEGQWYFNYRVADGGDERTGVISILTRMMNPIEGYDLAGTIEALEVEPENRPLMDAFLPILREQQKDMKFFQYDTHRPIGDLYAFANVRDRMIAFWKGVKADPVVAFHEASEYLIAKNIMKLIYVEGKMHVFLNGKVACDPIPVRSPKGLGESVNIPDHYLLRSLQERLFPDEDRLLSKAIHDRSNAPIERMKVSDDVTSKMNQALSEKANWGLHPVKDIEPMEGINKQVYAVGDIHGDLDAFRDILEGLDLIEKGNDRFGLKDKWIGGGAILVQGGDVVDRGPYSLGSMKYLRYLQKEARKAEGKVVRLLGNHELFYLLRHSEDKVWKGKIDEYYKEKKIRGMDPELWNDDEELLGILREDIKNGSLVGAYQIGGKVFTHGALKARFLEVLFKNTDDKTKDPKVFEKVINAVVRSAVRVNDFNNVVFGLTGETLGGITAGYFSIVNNDFDVEMLPFDLVCFHDPTPFYQTGIISCKKSRFSSRTLTCVDVGMTQKLGGGRAALLFEGGAVYEAYPLPPETIVEVSFPDVDPNAETDKYTNRSQIGKRARGSIALNASDEKYMWVSYRNAEGKLSSESVELVPYAREKVLAAFRVLRARPVYFHRMMREFEALLNKAPPEFYYFTDLYNDLFGLAAPRTTEMSGTIALYKSISENPIAIFHEIAEYLHRSGLIEIKMHGNNKRVIISSSDSQAPSFEIGLSTYTRHRIKNLEKWDSSWKKDPHYLLRAVQLELFGSDIPLGGGEKNMQDLALTGFIKDKQRQAELSTESRADGEINGPFRAKGMKFYAARFDDTDAMRNTLDKWFSQVDASEQERYLGRWRWNFDINRATSSGMPVFMVKLESEDGRILGVAMCTKKYHQFVEYPKDIWELENMEVDASIRGAGLGHILLGKIFEYVARDLEEDLEELDRTSYLSEVEAEEIEDRMLLTHPAEDEDERDEKGGKSAKDFYYGEGFRDVPITWAAHVEDDHQRDLFLSISKELALRTVSDVKDRVKPEAVAIKIKEPQQLDLFDVSDIGKLSYIGKYYKKIRISNIGSSSLRVSGIKRESHMEETFDLVVAKGEVDVLGLRKIVDPYYVPLLYKLIKQFDGSVYVYDEAVRDLLGFADRSEKTLAVHKETYGDPIAVFHEVMEYLLDNDGLPESAENVIKFDKNSGRLHMFVGDEILVTRDVRGALADLALEGEEWAESYTSRLNDPEDTHYLIRILQREIFGESDKVLTKRIREINSAPKKRTTQAARRMIFSLGNGKELTDETEVKETPMPRKDMPEEYLEHLKGATIHNFIRVDFPIHIDRVSSGERYILESPAVKVANEATGEIHHDSEKNFGSMTRIPADKDISDAQLEDVQRMYYRVMMYELLAGREADRKEEYMKRAGELRQSADIILQDWAVKRVEEIVARNVVFLYETREHFRHELDGSSVIFDKDGFIKGTEVTYCANAAGAIDVIGPEKWTLKIDDNWKFSRPGQEAHINFRDAVRFVNRIPSEEEIIRYDVEYLKRLKTDVLSSMEDMEDTVTIPAGSLGLDMLDEDVMVDVSGKLINGNKDFPGNKVVNIKIRVVNNGNDLMVVLPKNAHVNLRQAAEIVNEGIERPSCIGKKVIPGQVFSRGGKKYVHVVDPENKKNVFGEIELIKASTLETISSYEKMHVLADERSKKIIDIFGQLFVASGAVLYKFDDRDGVAKDLFGFASVEDKMIALDSSLMGSGAAVFHEIGEYLIGAKSGRSRKGLIDLSLAKQGKKVRVSIKIKAREKATAKLKPLAEVELCENTLQYIEEEGWRKGWNEDPHYLLRVLQRELFEVHDLALSLAIRNALNMKLSDIKEDNPTVYITQDEVQVFSAGKISSAEAQRRMLDRDILERFIVDIKDRDLFALKGHLDGINITQLGHSRYTMEKMVFCIVAAAARKGEVTEAARILASSKSLEEMGYKLTPEITLLYKIFRVTNKDGFNLIRRDLAAEAWPEEDTTQAMVIMATELARLFDIKLDAMMTDLLMDSEYEPAGFAEGEDEDDMSRERVQLRGNLGRKHSSMSIKVRFDGPVNIYAGHYGYEVRSSHEGVFFRRFNVDKGNYVGQPHMYPIGMTVRVGRSKSRNNYNVSDPSLSAKHFSFTVTGRPGKNTIEIVDEGSTNQTSYELISIRSVSEEVPFDKRQKIPVEGLRELERRNIKAAPGLENLPFDKRQEIPGLGAGGSQVGKRVIFENPEIIEKKAYDLIRSTDRNAQRILSRIGRYMAKNVKLKGKKALPVDIVVDLSLISERDIEENVETWAYLMLMCRDMKNVNFRFEFPNLAGDGKAPAGLEEEYKGAVGRTKLALALEEEIRDKAFLADMDESEVEMFIFERIGTSPREDAIEILLMNIPNREDELEDWKRWEAWRKNVELAPNQYPVALEGSTYIKDHGTLLRNFEAGLTVGLAKASLALAKRADTKKEKGEEKELPKLKKILLPRLQSLFDVLPFEKEIELTEETLDSMVSDFSAERFNMAMDLALPPVIRMPIEYLRDFHEGIQLALQAA